MFLCARRNFIFLSITSLIIQPCDHRVSINQQRVKRENAFHWIIKWGVTREDDEMRFTEETRRKLCSAEIIQWSVTVEKKNESVAMPEFSNLNKRKRRCSILGESSTLRNNRRRSWSKIEVKRREKSTRRRKPTAWLVNWTHNRTPWTMYFSGFFSFKRFRRKTL